MSACNRSAFQPSFGDQDEFPRKYPKKNTQQIPPASLGEFASLASPGYLDPRAPAPWIKCS